jgi:hypothetical protein
VSAPAGGASAAPAFCRSDSDDARDIMTEPLAVFHESPGSDPQLWDGTPADGDRDHALDRARRGRTGRERP